MSEYNSGYGQAKADAISRINEMIAEVEDALHDHSEYALLRGIGLPEGESRDILRYRVETLRWMRVVVKKTM